MATELRAVSARTGHDIPVEKPSWPGAHPGPFIVVLLVGAAIWLLPRPAGVDPRAWHLLAIFVTTITGIIVQPLPMGAVSVLGIGAALATGTLRINEALSGFANNAVWLVVSAFFIAQSFIKTGLGRRIAFWFMALFGRRTLGLSYSLAAADLVLAPVIPSNTARAGGVVLPILQSMALVAFGPTDKPAARQTSAFLTLVAANANLVTSAMFITAVAANPLAVELARQQGVVISWGRWALAASLPGAVSLLTVPVLIYWLCPPGMRDSPNAQSAARTELAEMGPMRRDEWLLLGVLIALLTAWILGSLIGLDSTAAALCALAFLLLLGVLTWDDVCRNHQAWNTFIWFAALVMMATFLGQLGFIKWFSDRVSGAIGQPEWLTGYLAILFTYSYSHYLFASTTAQVSAMFAPFLAVALALGAPPLLAALTLGFYGNLSGSVTHYATAPGAVLFGAGYVSIPTWWKVGAVVSLYNFIIWLTIGGIWWKFLGIW